ncbi:MAG: type 1 glutamine amidotransferase [Chitinophagales bacterium]
MLIQVLQHEPFEGPGLIEDWANQRGIALRVTHLHANEALPDTLDFDWLVVMGGAMSVNDEALLPWLKPEKLFIKGAIDAGKTVIGICLGAQLIANCLGAKVYRNNFKEIGWFPVQLTAAGSQHPLFANGWNHQTFFHWHGETFDLPEQATLLAGSEGCKHQGFCIGEKVFAFQFHPETNQQTLDQMVSCGAEELVRDKYVMQSEEIMSSATNNMLVTAPLFFNWLDSLAQL